MAFATITPLSDRVGVEITGVDLAAPLDDAQFAELRDAFDRHSLVVFRDQRLTPDQHIAFSRRFGELEIYPLRQFTLAEHPEILIVSNVYEDGKPIGLTDAGSYWHSDSSYRPEPSLGSLLFAHELPAQGGDTLFVSAHAAYDSLPAHVKNRIGGLDAEHDYAWRNTIQSTNGTRPKMDDAQRAATPPVIHPVVTVHPATGRPALFVNEAFTTRILGVPEAESRELIALLLEHVSRPDAIYRHAWKPGDLVFWDNRATQHHATGCPPEMRRVMYRTTVKGSAPVGLGVASAAAR
jgi:taurine dioxygenase